MIKKTLCFSNPAYLSKKDMQLIIAKTDKTIHQIPIEDIGVMVLENPQITITNALLATLLENNTAIICCDDKHLPKGMFLNFEDHSLQSQRFRQQAEVKMPLKKQLWSQTVSKKILNQALHLEKRGIDATKLRFMEKKLRSGDPDNYEAQASIYYWRHIFSNLARDSAEDEYNPTVFLRNFTREPSGDAPNLLLNYGYAILRAVVARALVGSGLHPTLGIFHRNQYNAFCLADDIMEPYRPYVDAIVYDLIASGRNFTELNPETKKELLQIPALEIIIQNERSPLMVGMQRTSASLARCFAGEDKEIVYPRFTK